MQLGLVLLDNTAVSSFNLSDKNIPVLLDKGLSLLTTPTLTAEL